ncbi:retrotransposon gag protein [Tanacetum coccineum]
MFIGYYSRHCPRHCSSGTIHGYCSLAKKQFFELWYMASDNSDQDARYALPKLLQMTTVEDYQREFEMLIKRATILESLLKSFYISGLKPDLQCLLLRFNPSTLGEDTFKARITEARFEIIAKEDKEQHHVDEDIGVDDVSSAIDGVFHIGESNEVRSKCGKFSDNKESVVEVVVGGGEALEDVGLWLKEINLGGYRQVFKENGVNGEYLESTSTLLGAGILFCIFGGIAVMSLVFIFFIVPETKGLTLEEIEAKLL